MSGKNSLDDHCQYIIFLQLDLQKYFGLSVILCALNLGFYETKNLRIVLLPCSLCVLRRLDKSLSVLRKLIAGSHCNSVLEQLLREKSSVSIFRLICRKIFY